MDKENHACHQGCGEFPNGGGGCFHGNDSFLLIAFALNASYVCGHVGLIAKTIPLAQRLRKKPVMNEWTVKQKEKAYEAVETWNQRCSSLTKIPISANGSFASPGNEIPPGLINAFSLKGSSKCFDKRINLGTQGCSNVDLDMILRHMESECGWLKDDLTWDGLAF